MKRILIIAAVLLAGVCAKAQGPKFAVAVQNKDDIQVFTDNGKQYTLESFMLVNLCLNKTGPWTLAAKNIYDMTSDYVVFNNDEKVKIYSGAYGDEYSSMALRVKGDHFIVAGSIVRKFNKNGYEAKLFCDMDMRRKYETDFVRKSLKRDYFYGFVSADGGHTSIPQYDEDGTGTMSVVYGIKAVDYVGGKIFTTGWAEREYTYTYGHKYYLVRRCARVWVNGKETVQQYENRTCAAYSINVFQRDGQFDILTSGHNRGHACGWNGSKDMISKSNMGAIKAEAVLKSGSHGSYDRLCIIDKGVYFAHTLNDEVTLKFVSGLPGGYVFYDVAADQDNMDFYVVGGEPESKVVEVYRIHCSGGALGTATKVFSCTSESNVKWARVACQEK